MHWLEIIKDNQKKEIEITSWRLQNESLQEELGLMKQGKDDTHGEKEIKYSETSLC